MDIIIYRTLPHHLFMEKYIVKPRIKNQWKEVEILSSTKLTIKDVGNEGLNHSYIFFSSLLTIYILYIHNNIVLIHTSFSMKTEHSHFLVLMSHQVATFVIPREK